MKKSDDQKKQRISGMISLRRTPAAIILVLAAALLLGCQPQAEDELARRLLDLETPGSLTGDSYDEKRLEDLKKEVEQWREELNRTLEASQNLAYYHKLLGLKYMDFESFGLAYESFKAAVALQPENPILHYRAGVSAARMALSLPQEGEQNLWLDKAEFHQRRAVELKPRYTEALYALAILCFYELDKPGEAEVYTDRLLKVSPNHPRGLFLRANLYIRTGNREAAIRTYEKIIDTAQGEEFIRQAEENRRKLMEGWTGE